LSILALFSKHACTVHLCGKAEKLPGTLHLDLINAHLHWPLLKQHLT